ncbi:MAG: chemotaxis protein CheC [Candidatus Omnitrophica bacterium]|nr:chemotaxis protein CheC [Candidatus Omnitrophota bacterium]
MAKISNSLTAEEIDILKEVGNICVGNSTGILSQLLGGKVEVHLPGLEMLTVEELSLYLKERGLMVYGVSAEITSQVEGTIFLLFPEKDSLKIIEKFLANLDTKGVNTIQFGISIIKEVGGIAIFSYVNTLSSLLKKLTLTSVPNFLSGTADELLTMILREYEHWGKVCVIHTSFKELSLNVEGNFYLILNKQSADEILKMMRTI